MDANGRKTIKLIVLGAFFLLVCSLGLYFFLHENKDALPQGFVSGNGRLEATEVDVATKIPGRIAEVLVKEGDYVAKNQVVATMDTSTLQAQLKQAEAEAKRITHARQTAFAKVESVRLKLTLANKELNRSKALLAQGIVSQQQYDRDFTNKQTLDAEYSALQSSAAETEAAIEAAMAQTERIKADINDSMLKSPIRGPVLTRLAEPGEVLPAGGKILTIVDPTDIYMNVYLSERYAGIIPLGGDSKVILDAIPEKPFRARVAYVSEKAQFTPREVEASEERQKLVFRVTVSFQEFNDPRLKPGMPGVAYIQLNPSAKWPVHLK